MALAISELSQTDANAMKIAIPLCRNRIAPLFDVAADFLFFDDRRADARESVLALHPACTREVCRQLRAQGVEVVLCGAIARPWRAELAVLGIEVRHGLAGDALAVVHAFVRDGEAGIEGFAMPGRGRRMRRRKCCDFNSFLEE